MALPSAPSSAPGVAYTLPTPGALSASIDRAVKEALATVPAGRRGTILVEVDTVKGVNVVVANKVNDHVEVVAWVGKHWDAGMKAGAAGRIVW